MMCPYLTQGLLGNPKIFYNEYSVAKKTNDLFVNCKEEKCAWWNERMKRCKYVDGVRK